MPKILHITQDPKLIRSDRMPKVRLQINNK